MSLIYSDGFDNYNDAGLFWNAPNGATIDLTGTKSRTGIGAMLCTSAGAGNQHAVPSRSAFVCGRAYMTNGGNNAVFGFIGPNTGVTHQVQLDVIPDGSLKVSNGFVTLGQTISGLIPFNQTYVYVEMKATFSSSGSVTVRVNGQTVLTCSGNTDPDNSGLASVFFLQGPGGGTFAYADDVYLLDTLGGVNDDFWGPVKITGGVPISDSTPLQWTPSTPGPHWSLVNQIPQNGGTSFVQDNTPGDVDQYIHNIPSLIAPVALKGVVHKMIAQIDSLAGSRILASDVGGVISAGQALSSAYIGKSYPYDKNPVTGVAWVGADFPTTPFGPAVTA